MSKHTIALRGRSVPLSASTSVVASSRHPEEIDDAQPLVAENVPEENAQQVELVLIDGQDAGHTGSSKFSSLVKRDEAPGWKVGSCVVWNQVAKETQAIYEITEIGDLWRDFAVNASRVYKNRSNQQDVYNTLADELLHIASLEESFFKRLKKIM